MRRMDGSVDFLREWEDYKLGFGSLDGEFWAGCNLELLPLCLDMLWLNVKKNMCVRCCGSRSITRN